MRAALPLNVVPDASPAPPLLNVTALLTDEAVVADVADVAVAALPVMLMFQVPDALVPVVLGAPIVL